MSYVIVGLGNPGSEYEGTRHNVGRDIVQKLADKSGAELKYSSAKEALVGSGEVSNKKVGFVLPETFMNKSGKSLDKEAKMKKLDQIVVVHDDLDLPLGVVKLSFGKSSGGHRGVDSVMKILKSQDFPRLRIGISTMTAKGLAKKPSGEEAVVKHVLGKFKPTEKDTIKKVFKKAVQSLEEIVEKGYVLAMNDVNKS